MSETIERIKLGQRRRTIEILKPGTYDLCNKGGDFIRLKRKCRIERFEKFQRVNGGQADWLPDGYDLDTLAALPTPWERIRAWLRGETALPRAIVITGGLK